MYKYDAYGRMSTAASPRSARESMRSNLLERQAITRARAGEEAAAERDRLQRNVSVLLRRIPVALVLKVAQRRDQLRPRLPRADHFVQEPSARSDVGVGELLAELPHLLRPDGRRVRRRVELALIKNVHGALGAHHRELGCRPRVIEIGANVLARHHAVRAAV